MKIVVGLGNPGRAYAETRHNAGWMVLDALAGKLGVSFRSSWRKPLMLAKTSMEGVGTLWLVKPTTYMNCSGDPLPALMRPAGATPADLLVVVDDVNLPLGKLRIRASGGSGGHNGLKSIIERLGTENFARMRIGIGAKQEGQDLADHVLGRMDRAERGAIAEACGRAADAIECVLKDGVDRAMNQFN
jgi:PTH1 family peptidyl-tRNA hydrolase